LVDHCDAAAANSRTLVCRTDVLAQNLFCVLKAQAASKLRIISLEHGFKWVEIQLNKESNPPMHGDETFGERIRRLRKEKNWTQRQLAERVAKRLKDGSRGFDVTYLSKIENDKIAPPSTAVIMALAEVLNDNSDELLAMAGKAPPDLGQTLKESEGARLFYRSAVEKGLSDKQWRELIEQLKKKK
jgi:transcriptional regulator with XRE-family HTH domain